LVPKTLKDVWYAIIKAYRFPFLRFIMYCMFKLRPIGWGGALGAYAPPH